MRTVTLEVASHEAVTRRTLAAAAVAWAGYAWFQKTRKEFADVL